MMITMSNLKRELAPALAFIEQKWDQLRGNARDGHRDVLNSWRSLAETSVDGHIDDLDHSNPYILFLPNDYIYPGGRFIVQFYWDSYFIIISLLLEGKFDLAKGMVENFLFQVETHGMVIANRKRWSAGSQLPFLSEMVRDIYRIEKDRVWLAKALDIVEKEYQNYWLNEDHLVADYCLSRYSAPSYFPRDYLAQITMDNESTWDMSPRFDVDDILCLLPVDLNCNLFMYERNFASLYQELGQPDISNQWLERSELRKRLINNLMWDDSDGLYYDFNYELKSVKKVKSLATFFPLFYGLAEHEQAKRVRENLPIFEQEFGLATCDQDYGYKDRQWNWPVGWAPLHWIVYQGLKNYGYQEDAERIALKWLNLNYKVWRETGSFFEKYDVVKGSHQVLEDSRYSANQEGFGWTNGVFQALVVDLCETV